jgi:HEAT repeat protein
VDQLERWLDAINRPTFDANGCRDRAIDEMRAAGAENVLPLLADRLKAADPEIRCDSITALLFLDADRAVELVMAMLNDPDTTVRWHACERLYGFGDERAVPVLGELLRRDPDPQVRGTAAYAMGGIGSPAAIPSLLAALGSDNEYDSQGHSPSSCAATALDEILGTHETRIHLGGGLCRMADSEPDLDRLRRLSEELFQKWSEGRAEGIV